MRRELIGIVGAGLIAGCASDATLMRFAELPATFPAQAGEPSLTVSSAPASPGEALSLRGLSERAAAAYIERLGQLSQNPKALREAMAASISKEADGPLDRTKLGRVVVIGVQRPSIRPGDRYLMTRIEVQAADQAGFAFTGFEHAATEYSSISIGSITIKNDLTGKAEVSPDLTGSVIGGAGLSIAATRSDTATRSVAERQQLSVSVTPQQLLIIRTGAEGTDLTGNTLVKLSIQLFGGESQGRIIATPEIRKDGKLLKPKEAKLTLVRAILPVSRDLIACARISYQDRVVTSGAEYYDEGRQKVEILQNATGWQKIVLVPASDLEVPLWVIRTPTGRLAADDGVQIHELYFRDFDAVEEFVAWVRRHRQARVGSVTLIDGQDPLRAFDTLQVARAEPPRPLAAESEPTCPEGTAGAFDQSTISSSETPAPPEQ